MRLKVIQAVLLTAFVLSGVSLVLNQTVEAIEPIESHPTETQGTMDLYGPEVLITLPWVHLENSAVEGFLLILVMVSTMVGLVGSLVVSRDK